MTDSGRDPYRRHPLASSPPCRMTGGVAARTLSRARPPSSRWHTLNPSHPVPPEPRLSPPAAGNTSVPRRQGAAHLLSLPASSLLAPAKTFEVFEQQGNTFAFHLTCLRRPLKCIIAEQRRSPPTPSSPPQPPTPLNHLPSKGTFSAANPSSGKRVWPAISLSLPPFHPPTLPPLRSLSPPCSLSRPVLLCVCVTPHPTPPSPSHSCSVTLPYVNEGGTEPIVGQVYVQRGFERWRGWQPRTTWLINVCIQSRGNFTGRGSVSVCILGEIMRLVGFDKKHDKKDLVINMSWE